MQSRHDPGLPAAGLPGMQQRRYGRIVTVTSEAGRIGSKGNAVYAAAKAGIIGFTKSIARENARFLITANCAPGKRLFRLSFEDRHKTASQGDRRRRESRERASPGGLVHQYGAAPRQPVTGAGDMSMRARSGCGLGRVY
jgi:NAD(P)-dependent dehydrogenase (short-subunit alcohol dehydrogenase family)